MTIIAHIEVNAISIIILWIMYQNNNKSRSTLLTNQLYSLILKSTMVAVIANTVTWVIDGNAQQWGVALNIISNIVNFLFTIITTYLWALYSDYMAYGSKRHMRRMGKIYLIPGLIGVVSALLSAFLPICFYIDQTGTYMRGNFFWLQTICTWAIMANAGVMALGKSFQEHGQHRKYECRQLAMFMLWPFLGSVLQMLFYGLDLIWTGTTIALLIVFINVQTKRISQDALTGINNRGQFDRFLLSVAADQESTDIYLMLIDVDDFKMINDTYGHALGDEALIAVANVLKDVCGNTKAFLARYGGDEFVIIMEHSNHLEMDKLIETIKAEMQDYNQRSGQKFQLSLSMGYAKMQREEEVNTAIQNLLAQADQQMYEDKKRNKEAKGQRKQL